jgi:hypothetical protein
MVLSARDGHKIQRRTEAAENKKAKPISGSYFEQVVFEQPATERARAITERLLSELESRGVSVDPRTGKVTIETQIEPASPKSQRAKEPKSQRAKELRFLPRISGMCDLSSTAAQAV